MYKRNARADSLRKYEYVGKASLEEFAKRFPDDFRYVDCALYSTDMKIAYAYAVDGNEVWEIPESVEIYDNVIFSGNGEDYYNLEEVHIGKNLEMIVGIYGIYGCFGMDLKKVIVSKNNKNYSSVRGCLYSKDKKEMIYYPPKYTTGQFTIPKGTEIIKKHAIVVNLLPSKLIIPDSVKVLEEDWLDEQYDKGGVWSREEVLKATKIEVPRRFKTDINKIWREDSYARPTIVYR